MHGSLLYGFKQYVVGRYGADAWNAIVRSAGVEGWYHSIKTYPDAELSKLVAATSSLRGQPIAELLEEFGEALVPTLMSLYGAFVSPSWRTLDLLVHVEAVIHKPVRRTDPGAAPPRLDARRMSKDEVHIEYSSSRRLCSVAIGICRGVAAHYGERISIEQPQCMHRGALTCILVVELQPQPAALPSGRNS